MSAKELQARPARHPRAAAARTLNAPPHEHAATTSPCTTVRQTMANMAVAKGDMVNAVRHLTEAMGIDPNMDSLYSNRAPHQTSISNRARPAPASRGCRCRAPISRLAAAPVAAGTRTRSKMHKCAWSSIQRRPRATCAQVAR
eukprot:7322277-Prymnesium_polylepis.1